MTTLLHEKQELFTALDTARAKGLRIGVVPTMGALHDGHLSLIDAAREHGAGFVVVTVFVNPLQFGPKEDFGKYPRTLDADVERCRSRGVDVVFAPDRDAMYPDGFATHVTVDDVTSRLEGEHRPGHFRGVTTVVAKLFALTAPCLATFGRKDYQQWRVIERMTRDLDLRVELFGERTVREPDGLAMSSRNRYLDASSRERALGIVTGLRAAHDAFAGGERNARALERIARAPVFERFDAIDYVDCCDADTLAPIERVEGRALIAVAARIGTTRLIDNTVLGEDPRP